MKKAVLIAFVSSIIAFLVSVGLFIAGALMWAPMPNGLTGMFQDVLTSCGNIFNFVGNQVWDATRIATIAGIGAYLVFLIIWLIILIAKKKGRALAHWLLALLVGVSLLVFLSLLQDTYIPQMLGQYSQLAATNPVLYWHQGADYTLQVMAIIQAAAVLLSILLVLILIITSMMETFQKEPAPVEAAEKELNHPVVVQNFYYSEDYRGSEHLEAYLIGDIETAPHLKENQILVPCDNGCGDYRIVDLCDGTCHEEEVVEEEPVVQEPIPTSGQTIIINNYYGDEEAEEEVVEEEPVEEVVIIEEEPVEVPEVQEGTPFVRISFAERLMKSEKDLKLIYNELKAEFVSWGLKSRVSRAGDTFRYRGKAYARISVAGKSIKVHYALNPEDYADTKIPYGDDGHKDLYVEIPFVFKVKSPLSIRRAKQLIADACEKDDLLQEEVKAHNYSRDLAKMLEEKRIEDDDE